MMRSQSRRSKWQRVVKKEQALRARYDRANDRLVKAVETSEARGYTGRIHSRPFTDDPIYRRAKVEADRAYQDWDRARFKRHRMTKTRGSR